MGDPALRRYFTQPTQTCHRQYERLRAVMVGDRSQKEVAEAFGVQYGWFRQLMHKFRCHVIADQQSTKSPFFETSRGVARL